MIGRRIRAALHLRAQLFVQPVLFTLTIDRHGTTTGRGFGSAGEAHGHVTQGRYVAKLLAALGVDTWVAFLEFQKDGGWPHWHVLIDVARLPRGRVDLSRAWAIWRDRWKIGGVDLCKVTGRLEPARAINYVTKYLVKFPEEGFPTWALNSPVSIRFVSSSKRVGALVRPNQRAEVDDPEEVDAAEMEVEGEPLDQPEPNHPTRAQRIAACGSSVNLFMRTEKADGEVSYQFWGSVADASYDELLEAVLAGVAVAGSIRLIERQDGTFRPEVVFSPRVSAKDVQHWVSVWESMPLVGQGRRLLAHGCRRADGGALLIGAA